MQGSFFHIFLLCFTHCSVLFHGSVVLDLSRQVQLPFFHIATFLYLFCSNSCLCFLHWTHSFFTHTHTYTNVEVNSADTHNKSHTVLNNKYWVIWSDIHPESHSQSSVASIYGILLHEATQNLPWKEFLTKRLHF